MAANVMRSGGLCRLAATALCVLFAMLLTAPPAASQLATLGVLSRRAVLYDEDPTDPKGKQYPGSVIWQIVPADPSGGHEGDIAIRADVAILDHLTMTLILKRNTDTTLPASHTVELTFVVPPDSGNGISRLPGMLMKVNEKARGAPLAAVAVKVTDGSFLVGLSNVDEDRSRNLQLLREREWFDIPMVYANGHRAILAIEKGSIGQRVFDDALAAWSRSATGQPDVKSTTEPAEPRVVLYDEDVTDPKGKQFPGSVTWHIVPADPAGGHAADVAIRGEVTVPDRGLKATLVIKRNADQALPASHTVELTFVDFAGRTVESVPGMLMKVKESAAGTPFVGLAVKVTDGSFLVGLSNVDKDRARNIQLLREREWLDIPIVYADKRRSILAIEKGAAGQRAIEDALAAWDRSESSLQDAGTAVPK